MRLERETECRRFTVDEYNSLREEMIARIEAINNQSASSFTIVLTAWGSAIALLVLSFGNTAPDMKVILGFDIAQSLALFIPLLCLLPLAIKSGENLTQIVSISCYIRVFYEYGQLANGKTFAWESANNAISEVNVARKRHSFGNIYNSEYTILSIASLLLYAAFSILNYHRITSISYYPLHTALFHVFMLAIGGVISYLTTQASSVNRNMRQAAEKYTVGFLIYGAKKGILSFDNLSDAIESMISDAHRIDDELSVYMKSKTVGRNKNRLAKLLFMRTR